LDGIYVALPSISEDIFTIRLENPKVSSLEALPGVYQEA
jgi:hypothetical protein